jgi:pyridoxal phosphate enzyme (YggS family)
MGDISKRVEQVRAQVVAACCAADRRPDEVRLMGVTKTQPPEVVAMAVRAGLTLFGENKVQEARVKIPDVSSAAEWHFIGHLQSNKARDAAMLFTCVQTVDSAALAGELERQCDKAGRHLDVMVEVNVSGERSKFGVSPENAEAVLAAVQGCARLRATGLMTIAPWSSDGDRARPFFARLRETRDRLERSLGIRLPELSMGMTGDFAAAIREGSTLVRIGTALFGPRRSLMRREGGEMD